MKVRILYFLTSFTQLITRLKNFFMAWLLALGIKEGLVECMTVCVKSEVILPSINLWNKCFDYELKNANAEIISVQFETSTSRTLRSE